MEQCPDRGEDTFASTIRRILYSCRYPLPQFSCSSSRFRWSKKYLRCAHQNDDLRTTTPQDSSASHIGHSIVKTGCCIFRASRGEKADRSILGEAGFTVFLCAR